MNHIFIICQDFLLVIALRMDNKNEKWVEYILTQGMNYWYGSLEELLWMNTSKLHGTVKEI